MRPYRVWDQRVTWNSRLYTYRVLCAFPCSNDICRTPQKASCSPWRTIFHDPCLELGPRLGNIYRSQTMKNHWCRNAKIYIYKFCVLNHGEQTFRDLTQDGVVYRQGFWCDRECECLEFETRQVISRKIPLVQCRIVSQHYGGIRPDSSQQ